MEDLSSHYSSSNDVDDDDGVSVDVGVDAGVDVGADVDADAR